jgi:coenzyme PQQ precursor peptide PqqA
MPRVRRARLRDFEGDPIAARVRQSAVPFERRSEMAWKTPKIVEVPVGMEINMYACAARK